MSYWVEASWLELIVRTSSSSKGTDGGPGNPNSYSQTAIIISINKNTDRGMKILANWLSSYVWTRPSFVLTYKLANVSRFTIFIESSCMRIQIGRSASNLDLYFFRAWCIRIVDCVGNDQSKLRAWLDRRNGTDCNLSGLGSLTVSQSHNCAHWFSYQGEAWPPTPSTRACMLSCCFDDSKWSIVFSILNFVIGWLLYL